MWGVGEVCVGRRRGVCTGLGKFAPLKRATWGNGSARCKSAQKSASFTRPPVRPLRAPASTPHRSPTADCRLCAPGASAAPVLHPAWQNPAPASPPHRSSTADCATSDSAAPALPVRTACPPRHRRFAPPARPIRHRQFAPPAHPTRYYQSTRPGVPPANSETPRPPNGRRGVNTQRGVSARRLTRQLRKSPRPQRRHLRCRLLARPLRERQRPQEQQR